MVIDFTRTALIEDSASLLLASEETCAAFREAASAHPPFLQLGPLKGADETFALPILDRYRSGWESHRTVREAAGFRSAPSVPKTEAESTLAFVLGWLCHRAADRRLTAATPEARLHRDAHLFRARYAVPGATLDAETLSAMFRALKQRCFIEMHTFKPDGDDIEGWFDKLYDGMREWDDAMQRLAKAVAEPDAAWERKLAGGFYRADDEIVALAAELREGGAVSRDRLEAALAAAPRSEYGLALQAAVGSLRNANAYFTYRADAAALESII